MSKPIAHHGSGSPDKEEKEVPSNKASSDLEKMGNHERKRRKAKEAMETLRRLLSSQREGS